MTNKKILGIFITLIMIINSCYLILELYKHNIRDSWLNNEEVSQEAFIKLSQLGNWTAVLEFILSLLIVIATIWLIKKRSKSLIAFTFINIAVCVLFFVIGFYIAAKFEVAFGNLVQQLIGPSFIIIMLIVYQGIKKMYYKWRF